MQNLITFGDSYTDESRLSYFFAHSEAPPLGQMTPESNQTSGGGKTWPRVVADLTGASLFDYAVGGAMCSNNITSHYFDQIQGPFPSVIDYEIPTFKADLAYPNLYPDRRTDNTVYSLWIGTNDLGADGFLTDKNVAGTSIPDFVGCAWTTFDEIYKTGGRQFVLFNEAPLQLSPMYAAPENGGTRNNNYWGNKTSYNMTEIEQKMFQYASSVNALYVYGAAFEFVVKKRWAGATFTVFDAHELLLDIRADPTAYLSPPATVIGSYVTCDGNNCSTSENPLSSFLWYDAVHPSARVDEIIAEKFIEAVKGKSKYATYYR
ncbi:hypothetical protein K4F52_006579 [Lecanicillium sp. MT-2017a]|nr:hypothetical protein K4F52_006579 [Lecanicillium sp. MT-2017a]